MIAGIAGALSLIGTGISVFGAFKQGQASKRAEKMRSAQMDLEAQRARREQIRRSQVARAKATASAVTQGSNNTSALAGGTAQLSQEAGRNTVAINQDQMIGNSIFKANQQYATGGMISSIGSGITGFGSAISQNAGTLEKLNWAK